MDLTVTAIDRLLSGRYRNEEYPTLRIQTDEWARTRPLEGLKILDVTPVFTNTLLKYKALLSGGAELSVGVSGMLPNDAAVLAALRETGIPIDHAENIRGSYDIVLDCAGGFSRAEARIGYAELTRSGADAYKGCLKPVFMADGGVVKRIETCLGTGESFFRAMEQLGHRDWQGRKLVVFGSGKVGTGIIMQGHRLGAKVHVVTDPATVSERAAGWAEAVCDYRDREAVTGFLWGAYAVVTATGRLHALEGLIPAEELIASDTLLANMGVEDEWGPSVPVTRVVKGKSPVNFILDEPTHLKYIDATMALHNLGALYLLQNPGARGIVPPPAEWEKALLDQTRRAGLIGGELDLLV